MKIKQLQIDEFGPLCGLLLEPGDGIVLFEGQNESGKSSVVGFIRFMLYGLPSKKGEASSTDRERALGRHGGMAAGSMIVETDDGKKIKIERRANGSASGERVKMTDIESGCEIFRGEVPGAALLGVSQKVFDSTACLRQLDIGRLDGAEVTGAVENMLFSADAAVSAKKALALLNAARKELRNARGEGKLTVLERRKNELTSRLERAESTANAIREAEAQAARCRTLSTEIRRSLNVNEAKLSAFEGLHTVHRFDMLHAGERKIAELKAELSALEETGGFAGYLPDRSYAPALIAAAERLETAHTERLDAAETAEKLRRGRMANEAAADIGEEAARAYGESWAELIPEKYRKLSSRAKGRRTAGGILLALGIVAAAASAALLTVLAGTLPTAAAAAVGIGGAAAVLAGILLSVLGGASRRRAAAVARTLLPSNEKKTELPTLTELKERAALCADAVNEREYFAKLLSELDISLAKKDAALDAAREDAIRLLSSSGSDCTDELSDLLAALRDTAQRADFFCAEREEIQGGIQKYTLSVNETANVLVGEDEAALRAKLAPMLSSLEGKNPSDVKKARDFDRARLEKTEEKRIDLERKLAAVEATAEDPERIYHELEATASELAACSERYEALCLAIESIEGAGEALRRRVTPRLRRDAGELLSALTDGRYRELGIDNELSASVITESGAYSVATLSAGTRDAVYFSLRMALSRLLFSRSEPPLLLDETLAMLDDARAERLLGALAEMTDASRQCFIFTCHSRERRLLDALGVKYTAVSL